MSNRELEIILKLRDELTAKMKGAQGMLRQFASDVRKTAMDIKRFGAAVQSVGMSLTILGAVITGPLYLAFNHAEKYSSRISDEITRLSTVTDMFNKNIGEHLVPIMHQINNLLGYAYKAWENLGEAQQKAIVQGAFLIGIFTTFSGITLKLLGILIKVVGQILLLVQKMSLMQVSILIVVAAIILMITYWSKVREVAVPVLNAIEIAANMLGIGFHKVVSGIVDGIITMSLKTAEFMRVMARVPGPQQNLFLQTAESLDSLAGKMRIVSKAERDTISDLEANIERILKKGSGSVVDLIDEAADKWEEFKRIISSENVDMSVYRNTLDQAKAWKDSMEQINSGMAQSMSGTLQTVFFDAFTGQLDSAKDYMAEFGKSALQILTQVLTKMILVKTVGAMFPGMAAFFHQGGVVRKAHTGYLASDEVPIIAQDGEGIISRKGMAKLGASNLQRLNNGSVGGSSGLNMSVYINATDARSFRDMLSQHPDIFENAIMSAIDRNRALRHLIRNRL